MSIILSLSVSLAVVVATVYVVIKLVSVVISTRKRNAMIEKLPGNPASLLWGNLGEYPGPNEEGLKFQREITGVFPFLARVWLGPFLPMVMISHPETIKQILKTSEPKSNIYNLIFPWIGDGLLLSAGDKWRRNRRLLTPAFHFDVLKPYQKLNNQITEVLLNKMSGLSVLPDPYFEVFSVVSLYTLDVILQCAFSYKTDCQTVGERHPYVVAVYELADLSTDRFFKPWFHSDFVYYLTSDGRRFKRNCDLVHNVTSTIIAEKRQKMIERQEQANKSLDFLDILLTAKDENRVGLTDVEIRDEADTFLFEGHDTTASAVSWALYSLAEHRDIQTRVQEEVDGILDGRDSDEILWDDLSNVPFLSMCIKEAMRLHCPVPFIQRQLTQDTEIHGHMVPKGITINIPIYNVHHNPHVWLNSTEFIPERFSPENVENRDPFAFVPFSAGPRNCIGQQFAMNEMKTVIARILRKFDIELDPNHEVRKKETMIMRAENGIHMKVTPRKRK